MQPGQNGKLSPIDRRGPRLTPEGTKPGKITHIVPLPTIDSSFSIHFAIGPDSPNHPKLPALLLAISYLDAVEGPLWRQDIHILRYCRSALMLEGKGLFEEPDWLTQPTL